MAITPEKRSTLVHLLNIGTASIPSWAFINEGVTELTEEFNPDTNDLQYIGEGTRTTYVSGYGPSVSLSAVLIKGDPINNWIQNTINTLPVGSSADTQYIRFSMLDAIATSEPNTKTYTGYLRNASVSVDDIGGSAGEEIEMNVTLSGRGEQIKGVVKVTTDSTGKATKWEFTAGGNTTTLNFTVTSDGSTPINGATVTLCNGGTQNTNSEGKASLPANQNETYLYSVSKSDKLATGQVIVATETTKDVAVTLTGAT